jgi:hypothetical protein
MAKQKKEGNATTKPKYPRHSVTQSLRIPKAILEQNAGHPCTSKEAASYLGVKASGSFKVEVSSATKYGLLHRPEASKIAPTDLAKKILRPQEEKDEIEGLREAVLQAPEISEVYKRYRGEKLPDTQFFKNYVVENLNIPQDKFKEFQSIFVESLQAAHLIGAKGDKNLVVDATSEETHAERKSDRIKNLERGAKIKEGETCFVMQPFADPLGSYYEEIYKPAIEKAGLKPIRADESIFGAGKIMEQVWRGITSAKVLVAELTDRNPNVFYELGLAHALKKPVVLVSATEKDVPFDLQHIRVIYYDVNDPFWGTKLIEKVAENILSAIKNPEEAIFQKEDI